MKNKTDDISIIEKHIQKITVWTVIIGIVLSFLLPWIISKLPVYGLNVPNEIGDAIGGLTSPFIGILGILLTFLAFYVQYMANERQVNELNKQKRNIEYKYVQEEISNLKDEIRHMTYTKGESTYNYSEAVWYYMKDSLEKEPGDPSIIGPVFFQISYVLTLFEPLLYEIELSGLSYGDKTQAITNIFGIFESSLELILRIDKETKIAEKDKYTKSELRKKIIIPAKKVKLLLKSRLTKYKKPEKEEFAEAVNNIKTSGFIKQFRILRGKGSITYFPSYESYISSLEKIEDALPKENFVRFEKDFSMKKLLVTEPVKLLMKLDFLDQIEFKTNSNKKEYKMVINRNEIERYCGLDLTELDIDKDLWRDNYLGKFVYDKNEMERFIDNFNKA